MADIVGVRVVRSYVTRTARYVVAALDDDYYGISGEAANEHDALVNLVVNLPQDGTEYVITFSDPMISR